MSHQNTRSARLAVDALEVRAVPAVVTTTQAFRPLNFTLQGSVAIDTTTGTGDARISDNYDGTLTARGAVEYSSGTAGLSGVVTVDGAGRGVTEAGGYADTFQGTYSFADDNGGWTIVDPFTGTATQKSGADTTTAPAGQLIANGTFDPSNYSFRSAWINNDGDKSVTGEVTGTIYQTNTSATDLSILELTTTLGGDGTIDAHVVVNATGQLMKASSEGGAATYLTGRWESVDETEDAGFDIPIAWNAGKLTADITGLTPPEWATSLVLKVDGENLVDESRENNNTRDVEVNGDKPDDDDEPVVGPELVPVQFQLATDGTNHVLWIDAGGNTMFRVPTFSSSYKGPINLVAGDINGDEVLDLVAAPGAGGGPHVKYFDGKTGALMGQFLAYEEEFRGGVNIAVGDVNGDGKAEIITGTGEGGAPRVRVWDHSATGGFIQDFFAYEDSYRGGVTVVSADLNRDDIAEVVTGTGTGGAPLIHIYDGKTSQKLMSLYAGDPEVRDGVKLSAKLADDASIRIIGDAGSAGGVFEYRAGNPKKGEAYLVLLAGRDWVDVPVVPGVQIS